jgi:uroporphyrinogen-III synthase
MTHALLNRRVVNTRAPHQAAALDDVLRARGAVPLDYPCIEIVPVADHGDFDAALEGLVAGDFEWLALTSPNTVYAVARRLDALKLSLGGTPLRAAAIGPATRDAARELLGLTTLVIPEKFIAEALGASLPVQRGDRVLLPESAIARPTLADTLRARGAHVTVVDAYRTVRGSGGVDVPRLLARGAVDAITFTSASTVTNFVERIAEEGGDVARALSVCAACIGPVTAEAARLGGFKNVVVPSHYTLAGLAEAMESYFNRAPSSREDRS